jgi:hypothetical protein
MGAIVACARLVPPGFHVRHAPGVCTARARRERRPGCRIRRVTSSVRRIPWGILLFLVYAGLILVVIALSLRTVIDQAIDTPVSFIGVVVMALLAYTIFTITLVVQRKAAARGFALGLSTLTVPPIALTLIGGQLVVSLFFAALGVLLVRGLLDPRVAGWLDQA